MSTRVEIAVAVGSDVPDPEIDPEHFCRLERGRLGDIDRGVQEPRPAAVHQVRLAVAPDQQTTLVVVADERDILPPSDSPERHTVIAVAEDAVVIRHRAEQRECALARTVALVGVRDVGDETHYHLGIQAGRRPRIGVDKLVEFELSEPTLTPRPRAYRVGGRIRRVKSHTQGRCLLVRRHQLERHDQLHLSIIEHSFV
jgi:hypothetical protein